MVSARYRLDGSARIVYPCKWAVRFWMILTGVGMNDWDVLRYVLEILREGGLSGAARKLGVNHATVSRQLAKAEARAGTALFVRLPTGLMPTEAGRLAGERAALIEEQVLALDLALSEHDRQTSGPLTVTVPPLLMQAGVAGDIASFCREHPGVAMTVLGSNDILNLHRREADVAIRVTREPAESLWGRVIARQKAGWFGSPDLLRRIGADPGSPVPVISFKVWPAPLPEAVTAAFPGAHVAVETDDMITAQALARAGAGLLRTPCFMFRAGLGLERCKALALTSYAPIWVLTHPDLRRTPRVATFMRHLGTCFSARAGLYEGAGL